MKAHDFLTHLGARGVRFYRQDGVVYWTDPRRTLTPDERVAIRGLRREIEAMPVEEGAA